jgi:geranylgeranyl pyrophosphate synthase
MEQVERLLHDTLAKVEEPIRAKLHYSLDGGKRLRPALVILTGQMFIPTAEPFYRLAAAVDMLHTATLIHDDLLDEAPFRRGRETLHTIWPAGATVLAGDYLLGQAISLIAGLEHPRIFKVFGDTICTLCAGEIGRMVAQGERGRQDYYRAIEAKTASLFAASTEMAGILAGAEETQITTLRRFGRELGMAFQIVDDVLDFIGDEAQLGKPAGNDFRQGLITLPILYYLEKVADDDPVYAVLSGQQDDEEHLQVAIEAVRSSGAIEVSVAEARVYARRGQEALAILPGNPARQMLCSLADYVVERKRENSTMGEGLPTELFSPRSETFGDRERERKR